MSAEHRLAERERRAKPLLEELEIWLRDRMQSLSRHSEVAKAFAYALNQWSALTYYTENGWVEVDNNIAENALRLVSLGRKNFLFFGSDHGGERGSLVVELARHLPVARGGPGALPAVCTECDRRLAGELLPWRVALPAE